MNKFGIGIIIFTFLYSPIDNSINGLISGFFVKGFFNTTKVDVSATYRCGGIELSLGELATIQLNIEKIKNFDLPKLFFYFGEKREYCAWCYDGVKNYDEENVDCGGSCGKCEVVKGCYGKWPKGIVILLFLLLFVNSMFLVNRYDRRKFRFGIVLIMLIFVLTIIFALRYGCYSYSWIFALLMLFIVFYLMIYDSGVNLRNLIFRKRRYTKYDDLYNYDKLKERFDELFENVERDIKFGRLDKAKYLSKELLGIYNKLLRYLEYGERVSLYSKLTSLRNKLEMRILVKKTKDRVIGYKGEKEKELKIKEIKMAGIKIDEELLEKVKKIIKKGENRFDFPNAKSFVDKAVLKMLRSLEDKKE